MANNRIARLRIALISERRSEWLTRGYSEEDCAALTHDGEVEAVLTALRRLGHEVTFVAGIEPLVQTLAAGGEQHWDLAFNMAQGLHGSARESQVPAILEAYRIPYTFSSAATMALCQNKGDTKIVLQHHGIPSGPFVTIPAGQPGINVCELTAPLFKSYPLFVKLATEGSSKGVDHASKVNNPAELQQAVHNLVRKFPTLDILVETFLSGREFTVSILGTGPSSQVIGNREHVWEKPSSSSGDTTEINRPFTDDFATVESKASSGGSLSVHDYDLSDTQDHHVRAACVVALDAWKTFSCRDAGRVDIRFDGDDADSIPNVLEINPIGGLLPGHSPLPESARKNGISFDELLTKILQNALQRTSPRVKHFPCMNGEDSAVMATATASL